MALDFPATKKMELEGVVLSHLPNGQPKCGNPALDDLTNTWLVLGMVLFRGTRQKVAGGPAKSKLNPKWRMSFM